VCSHGSSLGTAVQYAGQGKVTLLRVRVCERASERASERARAHAAAHDAYYSTYIPVCIYIYVYVYIYIYIYTSLSGRGSIVANGEEEEKSEKIEDREKPTAYIEKSKGDR